MRVLERTRYGATLTDFGRLLASHAEALQSALSRASGDVALKKDGMEGSLVIGVSPVACVDIVPDAVALLKRRRQTSRCEFTSCPTINCWRNCAPARST